MARKIRVTSTVEFDLDAWNLAYGNGDTVTSALKQAEEDAREVLKDHFTRTGVIAN